jgi:hypothetical protein
MGNCDIFPTIVSPGKGIDCVNIPGTEQRSWLLDTITSLIAVALVF